MIILFILGVLLGAFAVIFALQNEAIITVSFFSYEFTASLSVILALALLLGVLITLLIILPESIKNYFRIKRLKKLNGKLADELKKQKELTTFAKVETPNREDIQKIEDGAIDGDIQ